MDDFIWGTGRRKTAVARVRIKPGKGQFVINKKTAEEYFPGKDMQNQVRLPLEVTKTSGKFDVFATLNGGGMRGQVGAVMLGLARALARSDESVTEELKNYGLLTRDPRMVERKKYGRKGARKSFQFSKR